MTLAVTFVLSYSNYVIIMIEKCRNNDCNNVTICHNNYCNNLTMS